ncbi:MAG: 8-oxo-dGTP diphosphatase [Firmicutes bacterium]|jgi:8-oxo-dGTP diphosphatase|nr:8-oxo-dGTP diphosphatase [Bacillota bacterium]MDD4337060.1 8-oxo-dGTP diphosphatase [Bacillota bacterium]MDD4793200.1 8-oxo-dGTP diphosphatase [Bacillota bacterium]
MSRSEKVILTAMCMVYEAENNILVQDRLDPDWPGVTFPGGHVKKGESFSRAVIREIHEETGLSIKNPVLCGIKQFQTNDDERYVVLFFKTNQFEGDLQSSDEGDVFWINRDEVADYVLAKGFEEMLKVFESDTLSELYYYGENDEWYKQLL